MRVRTRGWVGLLYGAGVLAPMAMFGQVELKTGSGVVAGNSSGDVTVMVFKGIPFAAPPIGPLRWRAPQPVSPWKGVLRADHFGPSCMQGPNSEILPWTKEFMYRTPVSEDCLYLNVWTPTPKRTAKLPVLVFVHGGAFTSGSGDVLVYDGEALAKSSMVVVTINYRLGIFGFLAHPELTAESGHHASGNYGLMDQIAALQWIHENISNFGGDPSRVAVAGQSAGAMSVLDLVASSLTRGLFHAAIADSGIGGHGVPIGTLPDAETAGIKFAASKGVDSIAALRALPASAFLSGSRAGRLGSSPIIDGWVLSQSPMSLSTQAGADNDVPVITGFVAGDSSMFAPGKNVTAAEFKERAKRIDGTSTTEFLKLYPADTDEEASRSAVESGRDRVRAGIYFWASNRQKTHKSPIFAYYFDRVIPWPAHPEFGAFHTSEVPYAFGNLNSLDRPWEADDFRISKMMMEYWKNMSGTGDPNGSGIPQWITFNPNKPSVMRLGSISEPMVPAEAPKLAFWLRYFSSPPSPNAPLF